MLTDLIVFDSLNSYVDNPLAIGGSYENKQAIRCSGWLELCVELIAFEILFQSILMHPIRVPLVHRGMVGQWMTDWNKIEGNHVVGQIED